MLKEHVKIFSFYEKLTFVITISHAIKLFIINLSTFHNNLVGVRHGLSAQVQNTMLEFNSMGQPVWDFTGKNLLKGIA